MRELQICICVPHTESKNLLSYELTEKFVLTLKVEASNGEVTSVPAELLAILTDF